MLAEYLKVIKAIYQAAEQCRTDTEHPTSSDNYPALLALGREAVQRLVDYHQNIRFKSLEPYPKLMPETELLKGQSAKLKGEGTLPAVIQLKYQPEQAAEDFDLPFKTFTKTFLSSTSLNDATSFMENLLDFCKTHPNLISPSNQLLVRALNPSPEAVVEGSSSVAPLPALTDGSFAAEIMAELESKFSNRQMLMCFLAEIVPTMLSHKPYIEQDKPLLLAIVDYMVLYGILPSYQVKRGYFNPLLQTLLSHEDLLDEDRSHWLKYYIQAYQASELEKSDSATPEQIAAYEAEAIHAAEEGNAQFLNLILTPYDRELDFRIKVAKNRLEESLFTGIQYRFQLSLFSGFSALWHRTIKTSITPNAPLLNNLEFKAFLKNFFKDVKQQVFYNFSLMAKEICPYLSNTDVKELVDSAMCSYNDEWFVDFFKRMLSFYDKYIVGDLRDIPEFEKKLALYVKQLEATLKVNEEVQGKNQEALMTAFSNASSHYQKTRQETVNNYIKHGLSKFIVRMKTHDGQTENASTTDRPGRVELNEVLQPSTWVPNTTTQSFGPGRPDTPVPTVEENASSIDAPKWFAERVIPVTLNPHKIEDAFGNSLLHIAAKAGHFSAVVELLGKGLSWNAKNKLKETVYDVAHLEEGSKFVTAANAAAHLKSTKIQTLIKNFLAQYNSKLSAREKWHETAPQWIKNFYITLGAYLIEHLTKRKDKVEKLEKSLKNAEESYNDQQLLSCIQGILNDKEGNPTGHTGQSEFLDYLHEIVEKIREEGEANKYRLHDSRPGSEMAVLMKERKIEPREIVIKFAPAQTGQSVDASQLTNALTEALPTASPSRPEGEAFSLKTLAIRPSDHRVGQVMT
ncbi:MAG: ankyrin repeat domain-containing protein [Gammaproteobacteria bacterium]